MPDITIKRFDTYPPLKAILEQLNTTTNKEEPIDLTNAVKITVVFKLGNTVLKRTATKNLTVPGLVEYEWIQTDLTSAGEYEVEFEIEWPETGGVKRLQTVPSEGYRLMKVVPDLENA